MVGTSDAGPLTGTTLCYTGCTQKCKEGSSYYKHSQKLCNKAAHKTLNMCLWSQQNIYNCLFMY